MKKYLNLLFMALVGLFLFSLCASENNIIDDKPVTYNEKHNLDFSNSKYEFLGWGTNGSNSRIIFKKVKEDVCPMIEVSQGGMFNFVKQLKFNILNEQEILLPSNPNNEKYNIGIEYKTQNLKEAKLYVYLLNKDNKQKVDSVVLRNNVSKLTKDSIILDALGYQLMYFHLKALGCDSTYIFEDSIGKKYSGLVQREKTLPQSISIKGITIKLGDSVINGMNIDESILSKKIDIEDKIPLKKVKKSDNPLLSKKIIGLGETQHFTSKSRSGQDEFIKSQILSGRTSLILEEAGLISSLFLNRYVMGDTNITKDILRKHIVNHSLADFIRDYNASVTEENKVNVLGFVLGYSQTEGFILLYNYLSILNNSIKSPIIDDILYEFRRDGSIYSESDSRANFLIGCVVDNTLYGLDKIFAEIKVIIEKNYSELNNVLGKDVDIILHYINNTLEKKLHREEDIGIANYEHYYEQSYYMGGERNSFNNAVLLMDLFSRDKGVIIGSHFKHTNYRSLDWWYKSLGVMLKEKYKDDYVNVVVLSHNDYYPEQDSGFGKFSVKGEQPKYKNGKAYLPAVSSNSLENILHSQIKEDALIQLKGDCWTKIRLLGNLGLHNSENGYLNEYYYNLKSVADMVLYIENDYTKPIVDDKVNLPLKSDTLVTENIDDERYSHIPNFVPAKRIAKYNLYTDSTFAVSHLSRGGKYFYDSLAKEIFKNVKIGNKRYHLPTLSEFNGLLPLNCEVLKGMEIEKSEDCIVRDMQELVYVDKKDRTLKADYRIVRGRVAYGLKLKPEQKDGDYSYMCAYKYDYYGWQLVDSSGLKVSSIYLGEKGKDVTIEDISSPDFWEKNKKDVIEVYLPACGRYSLKKGEVKGEYDWNVKGSIYDGVVNYQGIYGTYALSDIAYLWFCKDAMDGEVNLNKYRYGQSVRLFVSE